MLFLIIIAITLALALLVTTRRALGLYRGLPGVLLPLLCAGLGLAMLLTTTFTMNVGGWMPAQRTVRFGVGPFEVVEYTNPFVLPWTVTKVETVGAGD